jgi:hypothetical protein
MCSPSSFSSLSKPKPLPSSEVISQQQQEWFARWWETFWRKAAKAAAFRAFVRQVKTEERFNEVMSAVSAQSAEMLARPPERRPYAETWLDNERWTDLPSPPSKAKEGIVEAMSMMTKEKNQ